MSLYLKIHPTGYRRPVLCWSMIPPARLVVLITACSPFQGSKQTYYRQRAKLLRQGWNGRYFLSWGFSLRKGTEGSTSSKRYLVRNDTEKWFWDYRLKVLYFLCSLDTTAEAQVQGCKAQDNNNSWRRQSGGIPLILPRDNWGVQPWTLVIRC